MQSGTGFNYKLRQELMQNPTGIITCDDYYTVQYKTYALHPYPK